MAIQELGCLLNNDGKTKNNGNNKNNISFWIATGLHPHIWGEPLAMTTTTTTTTTTQKVNGIEGFCAFPQNDKCAEEGFCTCALLHAQ
jgi:hypothetical protein